MIDPRPRTIYADVCCPIVINVGPKPTHGNRRAVRVTHDAACLALSDDDARRHVNACIVAILTAIYRLPPTVIFRARDDTPYT
jgi:hypothetical protein